MNARKTEGCIAILDPTFTQRSSGNLFAVRQLYNVCIGTPSVVATSFGVSKDSIVAGVATFAPTAWICCVCLIYHSWYARSASPAMAPLRSQLLYCVLAGLSRSFTRLLLLSYTTLPKTVPRLPGPLFLISSKVWLRKSFGRRISKRSFIFDHPKGFRMRT